MDKDSRKAFNDYNRVKKEEIQRIEYAYNGSKTLFTMFIAFWSIPTTILAFIFGGNSINEDIYLLNVVMLIFSTLSFSLVWCAYVFSCKQYDNIYQVCSLACFNKVFYEYPKILQYKNYKNRTASNEDFLGWESLHSKLDFKHNIGANREYLFIAIASSALCFIFDLALSVFIFTRPIFMDSWTRFLIIFIVCLCVILLGLCMLFSFKTLRISNIKKMFEEFSNKFTEEYILRAIELNILTKDEAEICTKIERNKSNNHIKG